MLVSHDRPAALLLCAQIATLALARRLGREGVSVAAWDVGPSAGANAPVAMHSRYLRWRLVGWGEDEAGWVEQWIRAAQCLGEGPVLIATSDVTLLALARHRARLQPWFRFLLPPTATLELLLDKRRLHEAAASFGLAVPRSLRLHSAADLDAALAELGLPCLLKSAYGQLGHGDTLLPGKVRITSREQLHRAYAALAAVDDRLLLQEYLPGGADQVALYNAYFDAHHQPLAVFTGRKLRQYPLEFGTASTSQACPIPHLAAPLTAFLQQLGYVGPVDIGLKWDARQQRYKLLDVNPRLGQNYRTFVAANRQHADLGWLTYAELAGLPLPVSCPLTARRRRWKIEDHDWRSCRELHRRGELSLAAWALDWLRWRCGRHERAYWSWRDPLPLLWQWARWRRSRLAAPPASRSTTAPGVLS